MADIIDKVLSQRVDTGALGLTPGIVGGSIATPSGMYPQTAQAPISQVGLPSSLPGTTTPVGLNLPMGGNQVTNILSTAKETPQQGTISAVSGTTAPKVAGASVAASPIAPIQPINTNVPIAERTMPAGINPYGQTMDEANQPQYWKDGVYVGPQAPAQPQQYYDKETGGYITGTPPPAPAPQTPGPSYGSLYEQQQESNLVQKYFASSPKLLADGTIDQADYSAWKAKEAEKAREATGTADSTMASADMAANKAEEEQRLADLDRELQNTKAEIESETIAKSNALAEQEKEDVASQAALDYKLGRAGTQYAEESMRKVKMAYAEKRRLLLEDQRDLIYKTQQAIRDKRYDLARQYRQERLDMQAQETALRKESREATSSALDTIIKGQTIEKGKLEIGKATAETLAPMVSSLLGDDPEKDAQTLTSYASKYGISLPQITKALSDYQDAKYKETATESTKNYGMYFDQAVAAGQQPMSFYDFINEQKDKTYDLQVQRLEIAAQSAQTQADRLAIYKQLMELNIKKASSSVPGQIISASTGLPVAMSSTETDYYNGYGQFLNYYVPTIAGMVDNVWQGAVTGRIQKFSSTAPLAQYLVGKTAQDFMATVSDMNNTMLYLRSGKQINEAEFKRLAESLPDIKKTVEQNKVLINRFYTTMKSAYDGRLRVRGWKVADGTEKSSVDTSNINLEDDFNW